MKKQEFITQIQNAVQNIYDHYDGSDWQSIVIPSDRFMDVYIVGQFNKRGIAGVYVTFDNGDTEHSYNVTNQIIEETHNFKDAYITDVDAAATSMTKTIISAMPNITQLLDYNIEELRYQFVTTPFPVTETVYI